MPGKKSTKENKRKHAEARHDAGRKRRSTESSLEPECKEEAEQQQGPDEPSDIEEGGLDLSVAFKPISSYLADRREMLEQCFQVLGENKLKKMLPAELKDCSVAEIKKLCWEQLERLSQNNLLQILEGEEVTAGSDAEDEAHRVKMDVYSQQDNSVDSTSSFKGNIKPEDLKQEGGGSGEESDVLSINADAYDSDIEGPKEEVLERLVQPGPNPDPLKHADPKKELQNDIERSVSEILNLGGASERAEPQARAPARECGEATVGVVEAGEVTATTPPAAVLPSAQQLELLELEMRARAIKALMKANEVRKKSCT